MNLDKVSVNIDRVRKRLEKLSLIGKQADDGTTRLSYSKEWKKAVDLIISWMHEIGMETRLDAVGNLFGCYQGVDPALPKVMTGSHLDTVPNGGDFDGALGIIGGIEVANIWRDLGFKPKRSLEIVATIEEESSLFGIGCLGSRLMVGDMNDTEISNLKDKQGLPFRKYLRDAQLDPEKISNALIDKQTIKCFLELHIEQGAVLDNLKKPVGIVYKVVGIKRTHLRFLGRFNHGNTAMDRRSDALVAASEFVLWINKKASSSDNKFVATVGKLDALPGQQNIIPGQVDFTLEIRSPSSTCFEHLNTQIVEFFKYIEETYGVECLIVKELFVEPKNLNLEISNLLKRIAKKNIIESLEMVSWAGHDAKILSSVIPSGMIFVPSVGGISHSSVEFTHWKDVQKGIEILHGALCNLAQS